MRLKKAFETLLARERVCRVATVGTAGVPHVVPVCHVVADGVVCFASDRTAKKTKNVRANPHAAVTVDLYAEEWSSLKGIMVQGAVTVIERGPRFRKIRRLLYAKYPQYPETEPLEEGETVMIAVTPRHVYSWGIE